MIRKKVDVLFVETANRTHNRSRVACLSLISSRPRNQVQQALNSYNYGQKNVTAEQVMAVVARAWHERAPDFFDSSTSDKARNSAQYTAVRRSLIVMENKNIPCHTTATEQYAVFLFVEISWLPFSKVTWLAKPTLNGTKINKRQMPQHGVCRWGLLRMKDEVLVRV